MNSHDPSAQAAPRHAGQLLVECLIAQGVKHAFGVPGESYLAVLDGFHAHQGEIEFVICRQEGGAAFMAEAMGKLSGRPGVCMVTRGPGATNATVGIHTAFQDSTPMVIFVGDVGRDMRDREAFQEVDFNSFLGPSTKGMAKLVERIDEARRIPEYVARAFATAMNGRPGPVVLVLPEDMLMEAVAPEVQPLRQVPPVRYHSPADDWQAVRAALLQARQPLLIVGGPGWTPAGAQALQAFAERWQLPVACALRFQDTFDNRHPLYAGDLSIGMNPALAERVKAADLVLALGPRLGEMTTVGYTLLSVPRPAQTLIHVHPGAEELNRVYQADLALCATLPEAAAALAALPGPDWPSAPWADWAGAAHADYVANVSLPPEATPLDMPRLIATLEKHLPADALLVTGAGNFSGWLHRYYHHPSIALGHKTQLSPINGAMGYGVPAGIGTAIATGRLALVLTGDGDFLMNGQELATAMQYGGRSIVVLLNNGMYGTIRLHQEREFPGHVAGTRLTNPNFAELARSYGWAGVRITQTAEFEPALTEALARGGHTLIEVMLDPEVLTNRATLSGVRAAAIKRLGQGD